MIFIATSNFWKIITLLYNSVNPLYLMQTSVLVITKAHTGKPIVLISQTCCKIAALFHLRIILPLSPSSLTLKEIWGI